MTENHWFPTGKSPPPLAGSLNRPPPLPPNSLDLSQFPPLSVSLPLSSSFPPSLLTTSYSQIALVNEPVIEGPSVVSLISVTPPTAPCLVPQPMEIGSVTQDPKATVTLGTNPRKISDVLYSDQAPGPAPDGSSMDINGVPTLSDVDPMLDTEILPTPVETVTPKGIHSPPRTLTWAGRARVLADKSLTSVTTPTISSTGKPIVKVPDGVFVRRAKTYKEFLVSYFFGKTPLIGLIQSVLNHM